MKIAVLTPLPPVRSGIAHYSAMVLPELARRHEVTAVVDQPEVDLEACSWMPFERFANDPPSFEAVICQLGNNVHHEFAWNWARRNPAVIVLHEVVLHHLLVETTLARGDGDGLVRALRDEYGEAGAKVARARVAGIHGEIANFLMPASAGVAEHSKHVIVHNEWAASRLRGEGVTVPITVVPHPYEAPPAFGREEVGRVRREAGWSDSGKIMGAFGFVTAAKRPAVVMNAFAKALKRDQTLRLVFVGEAAPDVDLSALAAAAGVPPERWMTTGYVTDREFDLWMNVVDRVVSLRYPTAGESSGPIVRAFAVGRPVAVSDYAQFAEFPASLVVRIPFDGEVEAVVRFMTDSTIDAAAIGRAQREWLSSTSTVSDTADGYDAALRAEGGRVTPLRVEDGIAIYPCLEAELEEIRQAENAVSVVVRLTNRGDSTLACAAWGKPAYLLQATLVTADGRRLDSTQRLPGDLRTGHSALVALSFPACEADRVELRHSLSGIPDVDLEAFAVLEAR